MITQQRDFDTKLTKALAIGMAKARALGYPAEQMKVTLWRCGRYCKVYFAPVPKPNVAVLGGDLTIKLDFETLRVIDFERGQ